MKNRSLVVQECLALEDCLEQAYGDLNQLVLMNAGALHSYRDDIKGQRFALAINKIFLQNANENRYKFDPKHMPREGQFAVDRFFERVTRLNNLGVPLPISYNWFHNYLMWSNFVSDASEIIDKKTEKPYEMMKGLWGCCKELKKLIGLTEIDIDHFLIHILMDKKFPESFESEISPNIICDAFGIIKGHGLYRQRSLEYFERRFGTKMSELIKKLLMT